MLGKLAYSCVYFLRSRQSRIGGFPSRAASRFSQPQFLSVFFTLSFVISAIFVDGCSSNGMMIAPPPPGPTNVSLMLSSTGNDQLSEFFLPFSSITLTNKAGSSVTLFTNPTPALPGQIVELIHLDGNLEPLVTVSVPHDIYTSAAVTFAAPLFCYLTVDSAGALTTHCDGDSFGPESATVNLASPITVSGTAMSLLLNLQVSPSVSFSTGTNGNGDTFTITPTFNLTSLAISQEPTNDQNGEIPRIQGRVASITAAGNSFSIQMPDHSALTIQSGNNTVYQGIGAFSALTAGMFVNLDATIQQDGSILATRVAVQDPTATNVLMGPLVDHGMTPFDPNAFMVDVLGTQQQGDDLTAQPSSIQRYELESNTTYLMAGQFTNISSLPFPANFSASSFFPGQNIYVSSPAISFVAIPLTPATTITLMPQTINGTVSAISSSGNFQIYTVALAPYDSLTQLDAATQVIVYVDASTHALNSSPVAVGNLLRLNGLIFNDNGTLRMDCDQINDGVTE
jgi:hypothetical protein